MARGVLRCYSSSAIAMLTMIPTQTVRRTIRILYAEDVHELRDLARVVFAREGHSVECAVDGAEALVRLNETPDAYDLLITDHHMPRMNGLQLVKEVRKRTFKGKIMVFSSELNPAVAAAYHELNVDRVLFKPVFPSSLRQTICEMFPPVAA